MDLSTLSPDEGFILHDECICTTITMRGKCQVWLTNKNIILSLIHSLETTSDILKADVIRKTLEIVLRYTADDM